MGKPGSLIGEHCLEELLSQTISVALNLKFISKKALETLVVDSTAQSKAITHCRDSRLEVACQKLVKVAKDAGIRLKQIFAKEGMQLTRKLAVTHMLANSVAGESPSTDNVPAWLNWAD